MANKNRKIFGFLRKKSVLRKKVYFDVPHAIAGAWAHFRRTHFSWALSKISSIVCSEPLRSGSCAYVFCFSVVCFLPFCLFTRTKCTAILLTGPLCVRIRASLGMCTTLLCHCSDFQTEEFQYVLVLLR